MTATSRLYTHVIQRYYPFRGGSERYFQAFSERFVESGARVQVVTSNAWDLEYFWDRRRDRVGEPRGVHHGVEIHRVPVRHLPASGLTHRGIRRLMAESSRFSFPIQRPALAAGSTFGPWLPGLSNHLARLDKPDLVNSANIAFESMVAAADQCARKIGVPHVITPFLHLGEPGDAKVRRYYTMPHQLGLLRAADAVMVLTGVEAEYLSSSHIHPDRIHMVGAGIDVESVTGGDANALRRRLGIDGPIVLALGAAAYDKGTCHLIAAVQELRRLGSDVQLVIAGPVMEDVRRFLRSIGAEERTPIHVLGFVSDDDRRDLLAAADVLALPSRTESFGLVFMEAWANGKPVIGARAGAIPAVVADGEDGLLVEFGDIHGLANAIHDIVEDTGAGRDLGRRGQAKVVTEDQWFERVRAVYDGLLGSTGDTVVKEH